MRTITLFLILLVSLAPIAIDAAWYQKTDLTVVDPIQRLGGGNLSYTGNNLEPDASLAFANLRWADLEAANLTGADLYDTDLMSANLQSADLTDARLTYANLYQADLHDATLTGANLYDANLNYATLANANLMEANLNAASLWGADLTGATLLDAVLIGANMRHTHLLGADLMGADLSQTDLTGADLSGSILTATSFWNTSTWTDAFYNVNDEPTWAMGMDQAWRAAAGIQPLGSPVVPEPAALLLVLFGLALLPRRRRR